MIVPPMPLRDADYGRSSHHEATTSIRLANPLLLNVSFTANNVTCVIEEISFKVPRAKNGPTQSRPALCKTQSSSQCFRYY